MKLIGSVLVAAAFASVDDLGNKKNSKSIYTVCFQMLVTFLEKISAYALDVWYGENPKNAWAGISPIKSPQNVTTIF